MRSIYKLPYLKLIWFTDYIICGTTDFIEVIEVFVQLSNMVLTWRADFAHKNITHLLTFPFLDHDNPKEEQKRSY